VVFDPTFLFLNNTTSVPGIVKKKLLSPNTFKNLDETKEQKGMCLFEHNHLRRHSGLKDKAPFDKLQKVA